MSLAHQSRLGLQPGDTFDDIELVTMLGSGTFGEVWKARQLNADRREVAVKILLETLGDSGGAAAWQQEVTTTCRIADEGVPVLYYAQVSRDRRWPYLVMELLHGETLFARLERDGTIPWRRALAITLDIARTLAICHGHAESIVHCDLKPSNIFLTREGRTKVLDFGIAAIQGVSPRYSMLPAMGGSTPLLAGVETAALDEAPDVVMGAPEVAVAMGTPGYASPEQVEQKTPDPSFDVFALGVVLYEMLTGELPQTQHGPFSRDNLEQHRLQLKEATRKRRFTPIADAFRSANPGEELPAAIGALVTSLLAPAPAHHDLVQRIEEVYERPWGRPDPPYPGLSSFDEHRYGWLVGRSVDVDRIVKRLKSAHGVVLSGPSGAGKSSLAVAGVVARLDEKHLDINETRMHVDGWRPIVVRPPQGAAALQLPAGRNLGYVFVIDQLEEILSLSDDAQTAFAIALLALLKRNDAVRVIATVRDDYFHRVAAVPWLNRFPEQNLCTVGGLDTSEVAAMVLDPVRGMVLPGDAHRIVGEVQQLLQEDPTALPLVQFALTRWWKGSEQGKRLTHETWTAIKGGRDAAGQENDIRRALGVVADAVYERSMSDAERDAAQGLLLSLFQEDRRRRSVDTRKLGPHAIDAAKKLEEQGLLRRLPGADGVEHIEVVHESLIKGWPKLAKWRADRSEERKLVERAGEDARDWRAKKKPANLLWQDPDRIARAREVEGELGEAKEFIHEAERLLRRGRIRRLLPFVLFVLVLAVVGGVALGFLAFEKARNEQQRDAVDAAVKPVEQKRAAATSAHQQCLLEKDDLRRGFEEQKERESEACNQRNASTQAKLDEASGTLRTQLDLHSRERSDAAKTLGKCQGDLNDCNERRNRCERKLP